MMFEGNQQNGHLGFEKIFEVHLGRKKSISVKISIETCIKLPRENVDDKLS